MRNVFALFLLALGAYWVWSDSSTTSPGDALSRAASLVQNHQFHDAGPLLEITAKEKKLRPWGQILQAELFVKQGQHDRASAIYNSIPETSAAVLDARVALLRMGEHEEDALLDEFLSRLRWELEQNGRFELLAELQFFKAELAEKKAQPKLAQEIYSDIRAAAISKEISSQARKAQKKLVQENPELFKHNNIEALTREATLLFREKEHLEALEKIQTAKGLVKPESEQYFQLLLLEEKALRKLKRHETADHLLLVISADAPKGIADQAVLKTARNAWNIDDQHRALQFLDTLNERFPLSEFREDSLYMEARILEEIDQLPEAKEAYLRLSESSKSALTKTRALNRIALLYLRSSNYVFAAKFFDQAQKAAAAALNPEPFNPKAENQNRAAPVEKLKKDIAKELYKALFWEIYSLSFVEPADKKEYGLEAIKEEKLKKLLLKAPQNNYYLVLAKERLDLEAPSLLKPKEQKSETFSCQHPIPEDLKHTLALLSQAKLYDFAKHEINWYFFRTFTLPEKAKLELTALEKMRLATTKANLYLNYSNPRSALETAKKALKNLTSNKLPKGRLGDCISGLAPMLYPKPYMSFFQEASEAHRVTTALLFSVSRTESHFNSQALSAAGAKGLMQLMPATAKQEGLKSGEDIYDPKTNITLGAKHLSKLISYYDGKKIYAISAYNAGSAATNRWRARYTDIDPHLWIELIGYPETKNYVKKVLSAEAAYKELTKKNS